MTNKIHPYYGLTIGWQHLTIGRFFVVIHQSSMDSCVYYHLMEYPFQDLRTLPDRIITEDEFQRIYEPDLKYKGEGR